jgi:hypothetical protein
LYDSDQWWVLKKPPLIQLWSLLPQPKHAIRRRQSVRSLSFRYGDDSPIFRQSSENANEMLPITGGPEGLRSLCNLKVISEDMFFGTIKTSIPPVLGRLPWVLSPLVSTLNAYTRLFPTDYPLKDTTKAWTFASGLTKLAFANSWSGSAQGLIGVIKGAL